jgi:hypothetical protein
MSVSLYRYYRWVIKKLRTDTSYGQVTELELFDTDFNRIYLNNSNFTVTNPNGFNQSGRDVSKLIDDSINTSWSDAYCPNALYGINAGGTIIIDFNTCLMNSMK